MKELFCTICRSYGKKENCAHAYNLLIAQYQTPLRFYHTFDGHIVFCITELLSLPTHLINDLPTMIIALMTHDGYHLHGDDEKNVNFARRICSAMDTSAEFSDTVCTIVTALSHTTVPIDPDTQLCVDIDLAILGQKTDIFDQYERNIHKEYPIIPDKMFRTERAKILRTFLQHTTIYHTEYFRKKYEHTARENISRSIAYLST